MRKGISHFNLRVYGLLTFNDKVVTVHEKLDKHEFTKFPGGGLEYGEGLEECLIREFEEEMDLEIQVNELFYVNEFFQQSAFKKEDQLIAFYFWVHTKEWDKVEKLVNSGAIKVAENHTLNYQYAMLDNKLSGKLTFPVDQEVAQRLVDAF